MALSILTFFLLFFSFEDAWHVCIHITGKGNWDMLAEVAVRQMNVEFGNNYFFPPAQILTSPKSFFI